MLRYQVGILKRKKRRILLKRWDRPFLLWLSKRLANWKSVLHIVQPETMVRWHREGFKLYWKWRYPNHAGRPILPWQTTNLIREIAAANPLWGAPRIHGELLKLGIEVSQASVSKCLRGSKRGPRSQNWKTFLRNHTKDVIAIDCFVVPTIKFKMLWVLVILSHDRREILRFAVTKCPSARWTAQQLREAYAFDEFPKIILHDRDRNFWGLSGFGFREIITAFRSPWQNAYVERVIGSILLECTDHIITLSEKQLMRALRSYQDYYNHSRTHLALNKDSPTTRIVERSGRIYRLKRVGGLHTEFRRRAA